MPQALRAVLKFGCQLVGRQPIGRNITVFPDDVFITSYPRSGNTWTRFIVGNLLRSNDPITFNNIESRVPEIYGNSDHAMRRLPRPRVLKSHEPFEPRYPHVIYVVRDPRDVAVSKYHYNIATGQLPLGYSIEDFVPRFIAGEFDLMWGNWADHVMSWLSMRGNSKDVIFLRYEDMKQDTMLALKRIALFLGKCSFPRIDSSLENLQRVTLLSSPEKMRSLERQQGYRWLRIRREREIKGYVAVRTAVSGSWRSVLSLESVAQIESAWGTTMKQFSYSLQTNPANHTSLSLRIG